MDVQTRVGMPMDELKWFAEHGEIIRLLNRAFWVCEPSNPNFVVYTNMPFQNESHSVAGRYIPEMIIYDQARLSEYKTRIPDWKSKLVMLVPDVCIRVITRNDTYLDVDAQVTRFISDGVRKVWIVNPYSKSIVVHTGNHGIRLTVTDTLDGGEVLPGFKLPLATIFSQP